MVIIGPESLMMRLVDVDHAPDVRYKACAFNGATAAIRPSPGYFGGV